MNEEYDGQLAGYGELGDWEKALTLKVGTAFACRECGNLVMLTRGGVGVLDLKCCGKPMEEICPCGPEEGPA